MSPLLRLSFQCLMLGSAMVTIILPLPVIIGFTPPIAALLPDGGPGLARLLAFLVWVSVLGHASWRCSCAIARLEVGLPPNKSCVPLVLMVAHLVASAWTFMTFVLGLSLFPFDGLLGYLCALATAVTHVAFVLAGALVEADYRNQPVRTGLLTAVYHLGGFGGVLLAKRTFKDSPAVKEFPTSFPLGIKVVIVIVLMIFVYSTFFLGAGISPFRPGGPMSPDTSGTPLERGVRE